MNKKKLYYLKQQFNKPNEEIINTFELTKSNNLNNLNPKTIVICTDRLFNVNCGGSVAIYNLACVINKLNYKNFNAKIYLLPDRRVRYRKPYPKNNICDEYIEENLITDSDIIIYTEIVVGNPLKKTNIIRWILMKLGTVTPLSIKNTWSPNDLEYDWENGPNKLTCPWFNPIFCNKNYSTRSQTCFLIKKGQFLHSQLNFCHPEDSVKMDGLSLQSIADLFNNSTHFYCYDPNCFFSVYATMCGCIAVIYPIDGVSKSQYYGERMLRYKNGEFDEIYDCGIAYGNSTEELLHATNTLNFAMEKIDLLVSHYDDIVKKFLDDMDDKFYLV